MKCFATSCLILLAMLATTANAGMTLSWTITPNAATSVDGIVLDKIVGTLTADTGVINAIDVGKEADPGITGPLYQEWLFGVVPTPALDTAGLPAPAVDTHFLFASSDLGVPTGYQLTEDGPAIGTYLAGTFGIALAIQATTLDFVQLYVPTGTAGSVHYSLEVSEVGEDKGVFEGTIPEPGTITLLLCGLLSLLCWRRRK